jgi:hypothetical protein
MSQLYWDKVLGSFAGYLKSPGRAMNIPFCFMKVGGKLAMPAKNSLLRVIQLQLPGVTSVPMVHSLLRFSIA